MPDGEVVHRRGRQADVHDGQARRPQAVGDRGGERDRGGPHVAAHDHPLPACEVLCLEDPAKVVADRVRQPLVDLARVDTADVIRLEDTGHSLPPPAQDRPGAGATPTAGASPSRPSPGYTGAVAGKSQDPGWAWFGDRLVSFADARVPLEDRGLQFGESLYEVVAVVAGEPFRLPDHVERMAAGAREIGLDGGVPDLPRWRAVVAQLYRRESHRTAVLYAQITGGTAPRRHLPPDRPEPFFSAYLRHYRFPVPAETAKGIAAITVPETRWQRRDVKTTMLLPAVLAKRDAAARGADEAIFVGQDGFVDEGASSTVFAVHGRVVSTPPPTQRVLPGVSMKAVEAISRDLGIALAFRPLTLERSPPCRRALRRVHDAAAHAGRAPRRQPDRERDAGERDAPARLPLSAPVLGAARTVIGSPSLAAAAGEGAAARGRLPQDPSPPSTRSVVPVM